METLRGIALMTGAMAAFALEDMAIKLVSATLPTGQILLVIGSGGALVFAALCRRAGLPLIGPALLERPVLLRNAGEMAATLCFVTAISRTPLSSASAVLQATPLAVTLGAAVFLGAEVGWRRWCAIAAGFAGVLMIVRPGLSGFQPASLFAVGAVVALAVRDLATRAMPGRVASLQLALWAFAVVAVAGAGLLALGQTPRPVGLAQAGLFAFAIGVGGAGYYAITAAMRLGDVASVTPFRYTRLVFAMILGFAVFGERPDALTLAGAAAIIGSGLYTLAREQRLRRGPLSPAGPPG